MKRYIPVCAHCSIVMDPLLYDDVSPAFVMDGDTYCPECFKEYMKDVVDDDPEVVAEAMGFEVRRFWDGQ